LVVQTKRSFFKRKGMPTPDASQFTQLKRFQANAYVVPGRVVNTNVANYQPVANTVTLPTFLPSFSNKIVRPPKYTPIGVSTGIQAKPKVPGGNVWGS